ncbi:helix-turn-helix domain-containing protein [Shinella sp. CPCC 101442]|uniref:helix-turn-helix domain-containing protein n=1 Tax=Shinella sp. CPCC 101442 TaxID=2932265 RepID=UPI0021539C91|nr:helix-turn-helix domain-containing protein [Shinella sp. CPCC 101442]MCR6497451.1 helix-turn-helix domain-containing protein [Shinella sp. CPCC 101442]
MDARLHSAGVPIDPFANEPLRCTIDTDTSSHPPADQFGFFQTWYAGFANVQLLRADGLSFPARQQVWQLGDLILSATRLPGCGLRWTHRKRPLLDHWMLDIPFSQTPDGGMVPGSPGITCLAAPDEKVTNDDLLITLFLPRTWSAAHPSSIQVDSAALNFLAQYTVLLHRSLSHLREGDLPHIVTATASLLSAVLMSCDDPPAAAHGALDAIAAARITRVIAQRLADRDLTPDRLCRAAGVSRSCLYRIFEPAGGVSSYIRRKRLLRTRDILADQSDRRTIASIAEGWGFTEASAYSRMFKKEFGMSPSEARDLGWKGVKHSSWLNVEWPGGRECVLSNLLIYNTLGLSLSPMR